MHKDGGCFSGYTGNKLIKHIISGELILYQRISLSKSLKADTLAELIHIINMVHPLTVDDS